MKKFLAFLLTFALLLVPFSTVSFAATSYTDVTLTGTSGWDTSYDGANNQWVLYLTADGYDCPDWSLKYEGLTIEYNDVEFKTNQVSSAGGNKLYCTIPSSVIPARDGVSFTVKAGQYEPDADTSTTGLNILNDLEVATVDGRIAPVTTVITPSSVVPFNHSASSFYFNVYNGETPIATGVENWNNFLSPAYCDATRINTDAWTTTYSGVLIDGQPMDYFGAHFKNVDTGTFYIDGLSAVAGTTITVKGYFASSTQADWTVVGTIFFKELTFVYDGSVWTASKTREFSNISLASADGWNASVQGDNLVLYLNTNGYTSTDWSHKYKGFNIECNGVTGVTGQVSSAEDNRLYCTIPKSLVPATDGTVFTIKAGQYDTDDATTLYGLSFAKDYQLVVVDDHIILPNMLDDTNVEAFNHSASSFYFSLKNADDAPSATGVESWNNFLSPANCDGTRIDTAGWTTTYNGVFIDGQPLNYWGAHFKNTGAGEFYIDGLSAVAGTTVTIKGYFASSTQADWTVVGNFFLNELTFKYDGSTWALQRDVTYTEYEGTPVFQQLGSVNENGELQGFYFSAGETAFPYDADNWTVVAVAADDEESGVYVNGEKTSVYLKKTGEDTWYVCLSDAGVAPVDGDEITILGSFIYDTHRITFSEYTYVFEAPETGSNYVGNPVLTPDGEYGSAAGFYFKGGDGAPHADDWSLTYSPVDGDANGVFLNGEKTAITLKKVQADLWYVCISDAGVALNYADLLTIKGSFATEDGLHTVTFNETVFKYDGKHFGEGDFAVTDFTITGLAYTDVHYDAVNNQWNMYFTLSTNIPGDVDATYYPNLTYEIDGVEYKAHWFKSSAAHIVEGEAIYNLYIPIKELPATFDKEYVVTIKANAAQGRVPGTNEARADGIRLTEDYQFVVGSNYTAAAPAIDYTMGNGGDANGIYLSSADAFPVIGWDYFLTKFSADDGVFVNGEATDVVIKKYTDGQYYVCLSDAGITAEEGTIVMLKGTFTTANLNNVKFQTAKYIYKDGQWKTYSDYTELPSTGVTGDANGDSAFNVLDLIRIKKFALGTAEEIGADADLNSDGKFNASDLTLAIRILLDITNFVDGSNITGVPTYTDDAEMRLSAYVSPEVSEGFDDYKAAGFTTLISEQRAVYGEDDISAYMNLATEKGLDVLVQAVGVEDMLKGNTAYDAATLKAIYDELSKYESFRGIYMSDEPKFAELENYTKVANALRSFDSDMDLFTSCLPTYTNEEYLWNDNSMSLAEKYSNYANAFGNLFGEFTYDFYPFKHSYSSFLGIKYDEKDYMRSDWFHNLTLSAKNAKGAYDTGITVQSYSEELNAKDHYREVTQADVSFQVYTALAYGMKSINYFTYGTHWDSGVGTTSCMIYNGQKTAVYDAVKNVNNEIKAIDHILLNFNWQGTIGISGDDSDGMMDYVEAYTSKRISAYDASNDAIIGCLKDSKGYDGFMLVNSTDPSDNVSETISVTFRNADHAKVYINGVETIVALENGTYSATLAPGQGIFVIPYIA